MKQLHEYDTPETEAHPSRWQQLPSAEFIHADFARSLEQRLAACRDALQQIRDRAMDKSIETHPDSDCKGCIDDVWEWSEQTLTLTAPK
jgi:hypothetical protein